MDQLAKQQACQLLIEQEIERGLAEGKSKYSIGKEVSEWVAKLFNAKVSPHTLEVRAHRVEDKLLTNVSKPQVVQNTKIKEVKSCGELMSKEFKAAWEGLLEAIENEKHLKWKTTSKEVAFKHVNCLIDVITIG